MCQFYYHCQIDPLIHFKRLPNVSDHRSHRYDDSHKLIIKQAFLNFVGSVRSNGHFAIDPVQKITQARPRPKRMSAVLVCKFLDKVQGRELCFVHCRQAWWSFLTLPEWYSNVCFALCSSCQAYILNVMHSNDMITV